MTREEVEAYGKIYIGTKFTHRYFADNQWITYLDEDHITDEEEHVWEAESFWNDYKIIAAFDRDWRIYHE